MCPKIPLEAMYGNKNSSLCQAKKIENDHMWGSLGRICFFRETLKSIVIAAETSMLRANIFSLVVKCLAAVYEVL